MRNKACHNIKVHAESDDLSMSGTSPRSTYFELQPVHVVMQLKNLQRCVHGQCRQPERHSKLRS
eukprot:6185955-Pleurochrysis_carterae.AAC.2